MSPIAYLLQASACLGLFFALYHFILSKLTFFTSNRWYLLATLALSFIIPLATITVRNEQVPTINGAVYFQQFQDLPTQIITAEKAVAQQEINWFNLLMVAYLVIAVGLSIRMIIVMTRFFAKDKLKHSTKIGHVHIIRGNKTSVNGSFLNYIFLKDNKLGQAEEQQIIQHEMLHVKLLHSVDRIFLEVAKIILWFNPVIYLYSRAVEENHEFEVDHEMGRVADRTEYANLLLHLSVANQGTFYHSFSKTPLEKRITMLFNQPTNNMKKIIYMLVLPIAAISCLAFANFEVDNKSRVRHSNSRSADNIGQHNPTANQNPISNQNPLANQNHSAYYRSGSALDPRSSTQFYSRTHIQKENGEKYDRISFQLVDGAGSANLGTDDELGVFIDGIFYDEEGIKKLPLEKTALLTFDNAKDALKIDKIPEGNYAIPFCFKTKL